jgi:thiol-disulfide isomerase/thioredoxin
MSAQWAFRACSNRVILLVVVSSALLLDMRIFAAEGDSSAQNSRPFLAARLVDEQGKPVAGADAGLYYYFTRSVGRWDFVLGTKSDAAGLVEFRDEAQKNKPLRIYARHPQRKLVAVQVISDAEAKHVVTVVLKPECRVTCRVVCKDLDKHAGKLSVCGGVVRSQGTGVTEISDVPCGSTLEFVLPPGPGSFDIETAAVETHYVTTPINIKSNTRQLDLGDIDHPATRLALLEGQAAPELQGVLEWKNSRPLKLADLRGKVVVLEFWGFWCGPCMHRGIPQMLALRKRFSAKDLAIIGIHVDDGDRALSVKELDPRLIRYREKVWNGEEITFPIALTAEKRTSFGPGVAWRARNQVCADYGVLLFPSTVLIDREGKVVGLFDAGDPKQIANLEKLIAKK